MKWISLFFLVVFIGCKNNNNGQAPKTDTIIVRDTVVVHNDNLKKYSNARFKDVTVQRVGERKFILKGQAQVFEAAFSWVIEDGHNELKKGHEMTDAGAPAFGYFAFVVDAVKQRPNSKLHIILFEASAKDGSRQHELPIPLY